MNWNVPSNADDVVPVLWGIVLEMRVSLWSRAMAFLEGPVNFHMGSCSQQPLVRTYEEDTERQETTNENRSCLCGLTHTRLYTCCACLHYPAGKWSSALGAWTLPCMQRFNKSRYASVSVDRPFLVGENSEHQRHFDGEVFHSWIHLSCRKRSCTWFMG